MCVLSPCAAVGVMSEEMLAVKETTAENMVDLSAIGSSIAAAGIGIGLHVEETDLLTMRATMVHEFELVCTWVFRPGSP